MSEHRTSFRAIIGIELDCVYHSPIVEGIFAVLLFVSLIGVIPLGNAGIMMSINPELPWSGTEMIDRYSEFLEGFIPSYAAALLEVSSFVVLLIPILIGLSVARGFENGILRTFLTYPVNRSRILFIKLGMILLMVGIPSTIASLFAVYVYIPSTWSFIPFLLLTFGFWNFILITSSLTLLFCLLFKRTLISITCGIVAGYGFLIVPTIPEIPQLVGYTLNPLMAAIEFTTGEIGVTLVLCMTMVLAAAMVIGLLILDVVIFSRLEV